MTQQPTLEQIHQAQDRLFSYLDGKEAVIDGLRGRLRYDCYMAIYPYEHLVIKLWWSALERDWVRDLTWSEDLPAIAEAHGVKHCRDCEAWCIPGDPCACCAAIDEDALDFGPEPCIGCGTPTAYGLDTGEDIHGNAIVEPCCMTCQDAS